MRLVKLSHFRELIFAPESAPTAETLRAQIERGEIPGGQKRGARYYVDLDEFERVERLADKAEARKAELEADPLLRGLC